MGTQFELMVALILLSYWAFFWFLRAVYLAAAGPGRRS